MPKRSSPPWARRAPSPAAGAALLAAVFFIFPGGAAAAGVRHIVVMDGTRFQPENLTVKLGDRVVWVNKDPFPHTATAVSGVFDSKSVGPEKSWKYTPGKRGVFPYVCTLHPTMKGVLRVE